VIEYGGAERTGEMVATLTSIQTGSAKRAATGF